MSPDNQSPETAQRQDTELPEGAPNVIPMDPPAPILSLDDEDKAVLEPLHDIYAGMRVAIPNLWTEEEDRFLVGTIRGRNNVFLLEIGRSVGKIEYYGEQGWRCTALARMAAIAEGLAAMEAFQSKSFTEKLLKKASKGKKNKGKVRKR